MHRNGARQQPRSKCSHHHHHHTVINLVKFCLTKKNTVGLLNPIPFMFPNLILNIQTSLYTLPGVTGISKKLINLVNTKADFFYESLQKRTVDHLICNHFSRNCRKVVREIWFEKSGSRKVVDQKKKSQFQNHFSRTTFLHFSRKEVAE